MFLHPVTLSALLWPFVTFLLCRHLEFTDPLNVSVVEAAAFSLSSFIMWLRSRYVATTYLNERQTRKTAFVEGVRRDCSGNAHIGAIGGKQSAASPPPRTVARVAPVLPAFISCCFLLLSLFCLMSAILHTIWYVRSDLMEME